MYHHHHRAAAAGQRRALCRGARAAGVEAAHIPGADFLDIQGEFSDQSTKLRFMMPSIPQLEAAFGLIVHVDDRTLNLQDFGRLLRTFAGWGMRISFVPQDRIADQPDIIIREPEDGDA